jgi:DivIVA domain-containing protein
MTDESFHLTPLDVRRFDFGSALRGYDKTRVEHFRQQVAEELARLVKQSHELEAKARGFHEQLRAFRERDKALNEALISAQQLRAEIREQADREAQLILREARAEAERLVDNAYAEVRKVEADLEQLVRQRRAYLAHLRTMVERHLAEVEAAEASPNSSPPGSPEKGNEKAPQGVRAPAWLDSLVKD